MLNVKLLMPTAKAPTVAHPGEDLGYDVYAAAEITIPAMTMPRFRPGKEFKDYVR